VARWGILIALGVLALLPFALRQERRAPSPAAPAATSEGVDSNDPDYLALAQGRAEARRTLLESRWRKARSIAVEKWRADLLSANALGEIGAAPPMLEVSETAEQVRIRNRGVQTVCLSLSRVTRPGTDAVERCQIGPTQCSPIKPGATLRLPTLRKGGKESCLHAALEYRVGNVDSPEPSWWSRTAINEFVDPPQDISYKQDADLHADIARFEATVEDPDRAARWRRGLIDN
jgi:hypothetical protein